MRDQRGNTQFELINSTPHGFKNSTDFNGVWSGNQLELAECLALPLAEEEASTACQRAVMLRVPNPLAPPRRSISSAKKASRSNRGRVNICRRHLVGGGE